MVVVVRGGRDSKDREGQAPYSTLLCHSPFPAVKLGVGFRTKSPNLLLM